MKIYPIAITRVDWKSFISSVQEELGFSPTRGLDAESISIDTHSAFLASLALDNKPKKNLRDCIVTNKTPEHISATFAVVLSVSLLLELETISDLVVTNTRTKNNEYYCIVTGNLKQWYNSIIKCCTDLTSNELREIFNEIYNVLVKCGYRDMFADYEPMTFGSTFILRKKK